MLTRPAARSSAGGGGSVTCAGEEVQIVLIQRVAASKLELEPAALDVHPSGKPLPHGPLGFLAPRLGPGPRRAHMCVELPRCCDALARPPQQLFQGGMDEEEFFFKESFLARTEGQFNG